MSTLIKRNSENLAPNMSVPSDNMQQKAPCETNVALQRYHEILAAWGEGLFNMPETIDAAIADFFAHDLVLDIETANGHVAGVPEFKMYDFETCKHWFEFLAKYDISELNESAVPNSQDPSEIWVRFSCQTASKETGKSMLTEGLFIYNFEGNKVRRLTGIYADPDGLAVMGSKDDVMPAQRMLPTFEPNPDPKPVFEVIFAAWGSGAFAAEDTKQASMDKFIRPDVLMDVSSSLLPDVFKVYEGHAGTDAWANGVVGQWEFTRFDSMIVEGLKPGCVMQRLDVDVKHKGTGKEAQGIRIYNELAYDVDGKAVYTKQFWANPAVAASLY